MRVYTDVNVLDSLAKEASCGVSTVLDGKDIRQRLKSLSESLKMANLRVAEEDIKNTFYFLKRKVSDN